MHGEWTIKAKDVQNRKWVFHGGCGSCWPRCMVSSVSAGKKRETHTLQRAVSERAIELLSSTSALP